MGDDREGNNEHDGYPDQDASPGAPRFELDHDVHPGHAEPPTAPRFVLPAVDDSPEPEAPPVPPPAEIVGRTDPTAKDEKTTVRIEIPIRTIALVVGTIVGLWLFFEVWSVLLLVFIAFLLTLALLPPVRWIERLGAPRPLAAGVAFLALIGLVAGFIAVIVPPLVQQGQSFVENLPEYLETISQLIAQYPQLQEQLDQLQEQGLQDAGVSIPVGEIVAIGAGLVGGVANVFFVLVLTFYLLIEGERTYRYLARYLVPQQRYRLSRAFPEVSRVVSGYVIGQSINSTASGVFAYITLSIMGVPEPLLLAVLAAVFDAVPIVGFPIATIPAVLLAATVSWPTAIIVLVAYVVYQQIENYVFIPRVFGTTLQVSSLSILIGVLVGGQLLGILGIILSLPLTAAIPVLERVWREEIPEDIPEVTS